MVQKKSIFDCQKSEEEFPSPFFSLSLFKTKANEQNEQQIEINSFDIVWACEYLLLLIESNLFLVAPLLLLLSSQEICSFLRTDCGGCQSMSNIIIINFLDHSVELMRASVQKWRRERKKSKHCCLDRNIAAAHRKRINDFNIKNVALISFSLSFLLLFLFYSLVFTCVMCVCMYPYSKMHSRLL